MLTNFDPTISLGIDYAYGEIGFCISTKVDDKEKVLHVSCINFSDLEKELQQKRKVKKRPILKKQQKRDIIAYRVQEIINKYHPTCVVVELIRLFSKGHISLHAIIAFTQIILTIRNAVRPIPVFEVDTRVWKKRMLGSATSKTNDPKAEVLEWAKQFMTIELLEARNLKQLTHNEADAIAISMFARHTEAPEFLKEEG